MKALSVLLFALFISSQAFAQHDLSGQVTDTAIAPIEFATVSLLNPNDSTLAFFGITNATGAFEIKNIDKGNYLVQVAFLGYRTHYRNVDIPTAGNSMGRIALKELDRQLNEVEITGERVPLMIKKDTIEYNAGAFKTRPDANVEELLKKLPGVDVDREGNIKAQGEDVSKVLVDGKEFFGDDPKVATKNLPADAIDKVQVFNKKSDASEFTGIDDGDRARTINLMLKDGKKVGHFGDVQAGGGTNERYKLSGKLYKFTKQTQFAAMGMLNNINQFGFSFQDYLNFNGGIAGIMAGGGGNMQFNITDDMPVNFGRPVTGLTTSGAGGANYSHEYGKNKRIALSYLGNGANKKLDQRSFTRNFTNAETFVTNSNDNEVGENFAHRLNLSWRNDMDSTQQFTARGNFGITHSNKWSSGMDSALVRDIVFNTVDSRTNANGMGLTGNAGITYLRRFKGKWSVLNLSANGNYDRKLTNTEWRNLTRFFSNGGNTINDWQFQDNTMETQEYSAGVYAINKLGKGYMLQPELRAGVDNAHMIRLQGTPPNEADIIDSLSPDFRRNYTYIRPELNLRKNTENIQYSIGLGYEAGFMQPQLSGSTQYALRQYGYILPSFMWQNEYSRGKRISFRYNSEVAAPAVDRMQPVPNITSPVSRFVGNVNLKPEYTHQVNANWMWFDQFSFTSLFTNLSGRYTRDKIQTAQYINPDLSRVNTVVNTPDFYNARANIEFSKPVRKLGITTSIDLSENFESGTALVNGVNNHTTVFTHGIELTFGNRKKEKWDIQIGGTASISDAKYSIDNSLNNRFFNLTGFTEISYRPSDHWYFMAAADVTQYNARSFENAVTIPILKSEISYYFLKANRGVLTLEGFDLLNQNKGLERISQLNYLSEIRSNTIGRYFMLSFKYRLSQTGKDNPGGFDINIRR